MLPKSFTPFDRADTETPIARAERQSVDEADEAGDRILSGNVCDVDALDRPGSLFQFQNLPQPGEPLLWIDVEHLRLDVRVNFAAFIQRFQGVDFVAEFGRLLETQFTRRKEHFLAHVADQRFPVALEDPLQAANCLAILLLGDALIAGRGALFDRPEDARPVPFPARIVLSNVQRAGSKLEYLLQNLNRAAQAARVGKRAVEFRAPRLGLARHAKRAENPPAW